MIYKVIISMIAVAFSIYVFTTAIFLFGDGGCIGGPNGFCTINPNEGRY